VSDRDGADLTRNVPMPSLAAASEPRGQALGCSPDERTPGVLGMILGDRVQVESDDADDDECRKNCVEDDDESHGCLLDVTMHT
jgi:hypothetical protein